MNLDTVVSCCITPEVFVVLEEGSSELDRNVGAEEEGVLSFLPIGMGVLCCDFFKNDNVESLMYTSCLEVEYSP
jgi:hypothetical protein